MTSDAEGVSTEAWTLVGNVWGYINPIGGVETFAAAQTMEKITHQVTIRYRTDVSPKMRFVYGPTTGSNVRYFLIHTMHDLDEAHRELDCMCEEFVTAAIGAT